MSNKIVIIDYGMGNLRSVLKKFEYFDCNVIISSDKQKIASADKLILPGVGNFANGVKKLKETGIWDVLNKRVIDKQTPILGICLGMQLMAKKSEEGNTEGLGWFDAEVVRFKVSDTLKFKVPHMGWNTVITQKKSNLLNGIKENDSFYFVHSYHIKCTNKQDILTVSSYDYSFASAIQKGTIYGVQFHPEKSHDTGEQLIKNFINII